ncbi:hypothetical protein [Agrococcus sp. ARC_14]|uniref:hypothetical protein n=1 Tax=Agrococcus sp. ARC_14 TaxID=2919927 RepID=UPI001F05A46C|nr:hypothetical protein [Agrococcus sp. ARC_14]MCH1884296.1 hypothetical protein [Agrococcus sp. ARC_14]
MLKLIIWDLDDTLWNGTLAEGDEVRIIESRVDAIRALNEQGVVNSICSKNDPMVAEAKLKELGLDDLFVFSEIAFEPKGALVKRIVEDMSLRFPDVVFADDNELNLREVEHACPGIVAMDSREAVFDNFLADTVEQTRGGSSRLARYRMLERKRQDRDSVQGTNEDFLRQCGIKMVVLERTDNLPHARRIEELINRTNQLNFLKTRVPEGSMTDIIIESTRHFTFSAVVWDNYGNHGLVGFASVAFRRRLDQFTFSCRTMNMGIESALASVMQKTTLLVDEDFPVEPSFPDWITLVDPDSDEARERVAEATSQVDADSTVRVMANCQSAAIAHYMAAGDSIDFDNWPRVFSLNRFAATSHFPGEWRPVMVYGAFVDYNSNYWPGSVDPGVERYRVAALALADAAAAKGSDLVVVLPTEDFVVEREGEGLTRSLYGEKNDVWRAIASERPRVRIVEISSVESVGSIEDPRHFSRDLLIGISKLVAEKLADLRSVAN